MKLQYKITNPSTWAPSVSALIMTWMLFYSVSIASNCYTWQMWANIFRLCNFVNFFPILSIHHVYLFNTNGRMKQISKTKTTNNHEWYCYESEMHGRCTELTQCPNFCIIFDYRWNHCFLFIIFRPFRIIMKAVLIIYLIYTKVFILSLCELKCIIITECLFSADMHLYTL